MPDPVPSPPPAPIGINKSVAAVAAGSLATIVIYIVNAIFKKYGMDSLPAEITAAIQTLITTAAVYYTPHGGAT